MCLCALLALLSLISCLLLALLAVSSPQAPSFKLAGHVKEVSKVRFSCDGRLGRC